MRAIANTQENRPAGVIRQIPWRVTEAKALPDYCFSVRFVDGLEGIVDMAGFLTRECGVFKMLRDPDLFNKICVEHGAVAWPGELDLAPDAMYDELGKAKIYVMR